MDELNFDDFDFEESEPKKKKSRIRKFRDFFKSKCPHCGKPTDLIECPHCGETGDITWAGPK